MDEREKPDSRSEAEWAADRERLRTRLDRFKAGQSAMEDAPGPGGSMKGMAQGFKIASEFIAGIAVGGAIGWGVDSLFGTLPFGLVIFLLLGFAAGVLNVVRSTRPKTDELPPSP